MTADIVGQRSLQRWMGGEVDNPPRNDLLVIKAMLEHGELVSDTLGGLYQQLLMIEEEGRRPDPPADAQPPSTWPKLRSTAHISDGPKIRAGDGGVTSPGERPFGST